MELLFSIVNQTDQDLDCRLTNLNSPNKQSISLGPRGTGSLAPFPVGSDDVFEINLRCLGQDVSFAWSFDTSPQAALADLFFATRAPVCHFFITRSAILNGRREIVLSIAPFFDPSAWMGQLDVAPNATLADITIPGSHDSGTYAAHGVTKESDQCQFSDFKAQLESGVRWLDLRLQLDQVRGGGDLEITHGAASPAMGVYLGKDILPVIGDFLDRHPTETVVITVNRVKSDHYKVFDQDLHRLLMAGLRPNTLFDQPGNLPPLKDLQGCVVLIRYDPGATFGLPMQAMPNDTTGVFTCGNFQCSAQNVYGFSDGATKWALIDAQLTAAQTNRDGAAWYVNFTSASLAPLIKPWTIALDKHHTGQNYKLLAKLAREPGPVRFGTLLMDFVDQPDGLTRLIIATNKLKTAP